MSLHPVNPSTRSAILKTPLPIAQFMDEDDGFFERVETASYLDEARVSANDKEYKKSYGIKALDVLMKTVGDACEAIGKHFINDLTMGYFASPESYRTAQTTKSNGQDGCLGFKIKDEDRYIERTIDMRGVSSHIYGDKLAEITPKLGNTFTAFFPGAKIENTWKKSPPDPENPYTRNDSADGSLKGENTFTLNEIINITARTSPEMRQNSGGVTKIKATSEFLKLWGTKIFFDLTLGSKVFLSYQDREIDEGTITGGKSLNFNVAIRVRIQYPRDAAMWMTSCETNEDFSLLTFLRHLEGSERKALGKNPRGFNTADRSSSPASTHRNLQEFARIVGKVPPRMNAEGFTMLDSGKVIYTNIEPDVDAFRAAEEAAYDRENGTFIPHAVTGESATNFFNKMLLVDWQGNIISYTNASGNIEIVGLQGSQPVHDYDIGDHLVRDCAKDTEFEIHIQQLCRRNGIDYVKAENYYTNQKGEPTPFTPLDMHNETPEDSVFDRWSQAELLRRGKMFKTLYENWDSYAMALSYRMEDRYKVTLYGYYATPQVARKYTQAHNDNTQKYLGSVDPEIDIQASNFSGIKTYYPHQRRILGDALVRKPENIILGVDPGGGKTASYTTMVLRYLRDGVVKRPIIVMPAGLKKQYVEEIYRFSNHQVRVFPLYLSVWDRLHSAGIDLPQLQAIIENQPPNTIFLTDYGFLKLRPKTVVVGSKRISTFSFAVWASRIFDMFVADESHKTKNLQSQMSTAFRTFAAYTKVRVQASGTVVYNNARDIIGQVNVFTPNALGNNIEQFEQSKGIIDPRKLPALKRRVNMYCKEYNANKREWSFLLPRINYSDHFVKMNPVMKTAYVNALNEILESVQAEIDADKTLNPDDPSDKMDAKITTMMRTKLTPLEIFINAPDTPGNVYAEAYKTLPEVRGKKEYLKSPKVDELDRILDEQFRKTDAKVLVMSYNKAISAHIMRWSRHRDKMLHYTAEGVKKEDLIAQFRDNPDAKVMIADENTLKEGHNLQFCSLLCRLQTIWTVGEFNQALARVERPDEVMADGTLKYNRPSIDFKWLMIDESIEIAKTARLYSKIIEKTKIEEAGLNKNFDDWFAGKNVRGVDYSDVPRLAEACSGSVTMSPDFVRMNDTFDALSQRHAYYSTYMRWVDQEFAAAKEDLRNAIAKELGVDPETIDDNKLRLLAMKKVLHDELPGSQKAEILRGYTPFVPGVAPYDPYNLGLVPASRFADVEPTSDDETDDADEDSDNEEEDNEEKAAMEEVVHIESGDIVVTEFGIGECQRKTYNSSVIYVEIPSKRGGKVSVKVPLTSVFVPETAANRKRLEAIYKGMKRKGLPTTTLTVDGGVAEVHDVFVPEEQIIGKQPIAPKKPTFTTPKPTGNQSEFTDDDQGIIPKPATPPKAPTSAGTGLSPRTNRPAGPTPPKVVGTTRPPVKPPGRPVKPPARPGAVKVPATPPKKPVKTPNKPGIEVHLVHMNNQLAIMVEAAENSVFTELGYHYIGASIAVDIHTSKGLANVMDMIDQYPVNDKCWSLLEEQLAHWKQNIRNLERVRTNIGQEKAFILQQSRLAKNKHEMFPWLVVLQDTVYMIVDGVYNKDARKLVGKRPTKGGAGTFEKQPGFYLRFCRSIKDMTNQLDEIGIGERFHLKNQSDVYNEYHALKGDL
jgi:hypothetical protein